MRPVTAAVAMVVLLAGCAAKNPQVPPPGAPPQPEGITQTITAQVHLQPELQATATEFPIVSGTFVDTDHGWMIADYTRLLATTDGGRHWQPVATFDHVDDLKFVSATKGWVYTGKEILSTSNGGQTWQPVAADSLTWRASFRDQQFGWDLEQKDGSSPSFLHLTQDGGQSWTRQPTPCKLGFQANAASLVSPRIGWVICDYFQGSGGTSKWLYHTVDGGEHWQLLTGTVYGQAHPDFPPGVKVQPAQVMPTPPGALPPGSGRETAVFLDETHGIFSLRQGPFTGRTYTTADGGKTWAPLTVPSGDWTGQFRFFTPSTGRILVNDQRQWAWLETHDGGTTWQQLYPPLAPLLAGGAVWQFFDADHGVAAHTLVDPSAILATADGGLTWRVLSRIDGEAIEALGFIDPQHGWVSTQHNGPRLYRTQDGGVTWQVATGLTGAPSENGKFRFADAQTGWLIHDHKLLATSDAGATWHPLSLDCDISEMNPQPGGRGWVIGNGCSVGIAPALLATQDGGRTWTRFILPNLMPTAVTFADETHGWLTDSRGQLYRTVDGGHRWEQIR